MSRSLLTAQEIIRRLEWQYNRIGNREGAMCPFCYQFKPPEKFRRGMNRKQYGHTPQCWLGRALKEMQRRIRNPDREPLKPCPFDGGKAQPRSDGPAHLPYFIDCCRCHARTTYYRTQNLAVLNWNRRV